MLSKVSLDFSFRAIQASLAHYKQQPGAVEDEEIEQSSTDSDSELNMAIMLSEKQRLEEQKQLEEEQKLLEEILKLSLTEK